MPGVGYCRAGPARSTNTFPSCCSLVRSPKLRKLAAQLPRGVPATFSASHFTFPHFLSSHFAHFLMCPHCALSYVIRRHYL